MNEIESIVNRNADRRWLARARAIARKRARKLRVMQMGIYALAFIAIFTMFFGAIGAVHSVLASVVSVASAMAASFALGLYVEMVRRR